MSDCRSCGMHIEHPAEFHPYAACLMFHACRDGNVVRANLQFVVEYGAKANTSGVDAERAMQNINWKPHCNQPQGQGAISRKLTIRNPKVDEKLTKAATIAGSSLYAPQEPAMTDRRIITYTVEDAAAYAHCGKQKIRADIRKGILPARKIGRGWVILHEPLLRYLGGDTKEGCSTSAGRSGTHDLRPMASALISPAKLLAERRQNATKRD